MNLTDFDVRLINAILNKNYPKDKTVFSAQDILAIINEFRNPDRYVQPAKHEGPKYRVLKGFVDFLVYRSMTNLDNLLIIEGNKGCGKSSLAMLIGLLWCKKLDIKFNPRKSLCFTNDQTRHAIDTLPKFSPIICDEAVNFADTSGWNKVENQSLKKRLAVIRPKHFLFILCFPMKISKVDHAYLENYVNYWVHVYTRGHAIIFVRDSNPAHDAWRVKDFADVGSFNEFTPHEIVKKKLSKHPNFWKMMRIPRLKESIYLRYLKVRESNVYNDPTTTAMITIDDVQRALLVQTLRDIMIRDGSVTMARLLIHIRNEYDIDVKESDLKKIINDSVDLVKRARELGIVGSISKIENAKMARTLGADVIRETRRKLNA